MSALVLSRVQFAWVIALHILLPAFTVGLSCYIATLETLWWATGRDVYRRLSAFWIRIFAVSFGMGVVSGIVMPVQFGTNWSRFVTATSRPPRTRPGGLPLRRAVADPLQAEHLLGARPVALLDVDGAVVSHAPPFARRDDRYVSARTAV